MVLRIERNLLLHYATISFQHCILPESNLYGWRNWDFVDSLNPRRPGWHTDGCDGLLLSLCHTRPGQTSRHIQVRVTVGLFHCQHNPKCEVETKLMLTQHNWAKAKGYRDTQCATKRSQGQTDTPYYNGTFKLNDTFDKSTARSTTIQQPNFPRPKLCYFMTHKPPLYAWPRVFACHCWPSLTNYHRFVTTLGRPVFKRVPSHKSFFKVHCLEAWEGNRSQHPGRTMSLPLSLTHWEQQHKHCNRSNGDYFTQAIHQTNHCTKHPIVSVNHHGSTAPCQENTALYCA